ncbi:hypothetical protein J7M00_06850 [bacterium]|nr:hypothetical protein [bacterium]
MSKELAQVKGIEGYIKKKMPDIYEELKAVADKQGEPLINILVKYAQYGLGVQKYQKVITPDDLEGVDPKAIYIAIKLLNWASQQYFTTLAYANVSSLQALHQMLMNMMNWYAMMAQPSEGEEGKAVTMPMVPMPMAPKQTDKFEKFMEMVTEGIRAFNTMMQGQVAGQVNPQPQQQTIPVEMAKRIAKEGKSNG